MRYLLIGVMTGVVAVAGACGPRDASEADGVVCYRLSASAMGRDRPLRGKASVSPGWIRIETPPRGSSADSGRALIIDADGAALPGAWRRLGPDTLRIRAFDDFLNVTIDATRSDSSLRGAGWARSDAELVRDSAGRMRELDRKWSVEGARASCDGMPAIAIAFAISQRTSPT